MKVFKQGEKFNAVTYSEEYVVKFWTKNAEGFTLADRVSYYAAGKGAHKAIEKRFKKENPGKDIINIKYQ